jgi:hypothetical protein
MVNAALDNYEALRAEIKTRYLRLPLRLVRRTKRGYSFTAEVAKWLRDRKMKPQISYFETSALDEDGEPTPALVGALFEAMPHAFEFKLRWF